MQDVVTLSERGVMTLPSTIRRNLGLRGKQQFFIRANDNGQIVLQPAMLMPVEYYSEARIAEFAGDEPAVKNWLRKRKPKK